MGEILLCFCQKYLIIAKITADSQLKALKNLCLEDDLILYTSFTYFTTKKPIRQLNF